MPIGHTSEIWEYHVGTFGITHTHIYIHYNNNDNNVCIQMYTVCIHLATRNIMGRLQTTPSGNKKWRAAGNSRKNHRSKWEILKHAMFD